MNNSLKGISSIIFIDYENIRVSNEDVKRIMLSNNKAEIHLFKGPLCPENAMLDMQNKFSGRLFLYSISKVGPDALDDFIKFNVGFISSRLGFKKTYSILSKDKGFDNFIYNLTRATKIKCFRDDSVESLFRRWFTLETQRLGPIFYKEKPSHAPAWAINLCRINDPKFIRYFIDSMDESLHEKELLRLVELLKSGKPSTLKKLFNWIKATSHVDYGIIKPIFIGYMKRKNLITLRDDRVFYWF